MKLLKSILNVFIPRYQVVYTAKDGNTEMYKSIVQDTCMNLVTKKKASLLLVSAPIVITEVVLDHFVMTESYHLIEFNYEHIRIRS